MGALKAKHQPPGSSRVYLGEVDVAVYQAQQRTHTHQHQQHDQPYEHIT